jgi:hypothetical protein
MHNSMNDHVQDEGRYTIRIADNCRRKIGVKMKALLAIAFLLLGCHIAGAQSDTIRKVRGSSDYESYVGPLIHHFPILEQWPPLASDMPFDVILAYIVADSVARSTTDQAAKSYLKNDISEEQLYLALKYCYEMVDDNPIRFSQWLGKGSEANYLSSLHSIRVGLCEQARSRLVDGNLLALLTYTDYILHVRVIAVESDSNTSALYARHANVVSAEILESIKGRISPLCAMERPQGVQETKFTQAIIPGSCILFDYRDEWKRCINDHNSDRIAGWIDQDFEYIVFLSFLGVKGSNTDPAFADYNNYTLCPIGGCFTSVFGMYPVVDGYVIDEHDDFGFGTGVSVEAWKNMLKAKIHSLTNR